VSGVPRSVRVSRVIRAPADQLFRAWTDPSIEDMCTSIGQP
jgi:uncharacterized protein YndB with AHSA1/START domain